MESRAERLVKKGLCTSSDALKTIKRVDRERRDYYRYYTGKDWSSPENYDLLLNTSFLTVEEVVEAIKGYVKLKGFSV